MVDSKERAAAAEHQQPIHDKIMKDAEHKWNDLVAQAEADKKLANDLEEFNRKLVQEKDMQTIEFTRLNDQVAKARDKAKGAQAVEEKARQQLDN